MTSITKFHCNICGRELTDNSRNPDHGGLCRIGPLSKDTWTNDLTQNIKGPHICWICIVSASEHGLNDD